MLPCPTEKTLDEVHADTIEAESSALAYERENALLEAYLARCAPADLSERDTAMAPRELSAEDKAEVAVTEVDVLREARERLQEQRARTEDVLCSLLEESELRQASTKKVTYEFKRDVVIGAENFRTGKTEAEKMMRYLEERLRDKDAHVEKLKLKNASIKSQIVKVESNLQQKEEQGEVLHYIDFDQLKIENQQYLERIEERNNELLRLKLTTGKTVLALNSLKRKLATLTSQSTWLSSETREREVQLVKLDEDVGRVAEEIAAAERINQSLRAEQADVELPTVMEYIVLQAEVEELKKQLLDFERKTDIANMSIRRVKKATRKLGDSGALQASPHGSMGRKPGAYALRSP